MPGQDAPGLGSRSKAPEGNTWMHPPSIRTANTTLYQSVSALSTYVRVCGRAHCSAHAALGASRVLLRYNTLRLRPRRQRTDGRCGDACVSDSSCSTTRTGHRRLTERTLYAC